MESVENAINNFATIMWLIPRGLGIFILIRGITTLANGLSDHQNQQIVQGALTVVGGIVLLFAREVLRFITGDGTL